MTILQLTEELEQKWFASVIRNPNMANVTKVFWKTVFQQIMTFLFAFIKDNQSLLEWQDDLFEENLSEEMQ